MHYRVIDVSSIKELARQWYPRAYFAAPDKAGDHRALTDIQESIDELRYYRRAVFVAQPGPDTDAARPSPRRSSTDPVRADGASDQHPRCVRLVHAVSGESPARVVGVAQLVEHRLVVPVAAGSSPVVHPTRNPRTRVIVVGVLSFSGSSAQPDVAGTADDLHDARSRWSRSRGPTERVTARRTSTVTAYSISPIGMRPKMSPLFVRALNANGCTAKFASMSPELARAENSSTVGRSHGCRRCRWRWSRRGRGGCWRSRRQSRWRRGSAAWPAPPPSTTTPHPGDSQVHAAADDLDLVATPPQLVGRLEQPALDLGPDHDVELVPSTRRTSASVERIAELRIVADIEAVRGRPCAAGRQRRHGRPRR